MEGALRCVWAGSVWLSCIEGKRLRWHSAPVSQDVDAQDAEDPLYCTAYVNDIYTNLRAAEMKHRPSTRYMARPSNLAHCSRQREIFQSHTFSISFRAIRSRLQA